MRLVIDASVAIKWVLRFHPEEEDVERALAILAAVRRGDAALCQPVHWKAEIVAVVARLRPEFVEDVIETLDILDFETVDEVALYKRAARLAIALRHHLFDTLYHAVALEHDAVLVTADARYWRRARGEGRIVRLADFTPG